MTNNPTQHGTASAVMLVIGSCISLQLGASLAVQIFPDAGAWGVSTLRLLIAGLVLWIFTRPRVRTWNRTQWRRVVAFGFSLGLMNSFFYASIAYIPLGVAVTIEFLGPLLLSAVLSRRPRDLVCVGLAAAGLGLLGWDALAGGSELDPRGVVLALIAGVFWICYILASARVGEVVPGQGGLAVAFLIGGLAAAPAGFTGAMTIIGDGRLLVLALGTALLGSLVPYSLELMALRRLPPGVFGILLSLEPVFAAVFGWLLLSQALGPWQLTAILLVITASIGVTVSGRPKRRGRTGRADHTTGETEDRSGRAPERVHETRLDSGAHQSP